MKDNQKARHGVNESPELPVVPADQNVFRYRHGPGRRLILSVGSPATEDVPPVNADFVAPPSEPATDDEILYIDFE